MYWTDDKVQVVCGCFSGTVDAFKTAVINKYNKSHEYIKFVERAEMIIELEKGA
jgi:hypothetical protein